MRKGILAMLLSSALLAGCASSPESAHSEVNDPFEGFNRVMWDFNYDVLDPYIARPASLAYVNYVPSPVRSGVGNFLSNLEEPVSFFNSVLVLDGEAAVTHFNRFWLNTFFGLGGLIDIATAAEIGNPSDREFGDTLGYYGVGNGPYLMYPIYGPSTVRETAGDFVDGMMPMVVYLNFWQGLAKWALQGMESRAALVQQEAMLENSPDPYIFTRDAYIQNRNFRASGGKVDPSLYEEEDFLEDYLDEIDDY
ncbi:MlaA family lipoprotein [Thaumasiovibrio subtropicus]|uniref:MlaA family lipoprotein n=1 Tax=Thaumasiovibrio subtropicus TaxID=1891207 RepID=UPI000B35FC95|nr:VacJ family lipoprotein [Thaumasiovibrio subtropicus]